MAEAEKPVLWIGSACDDLCAFPETVRRRAGHELHQVQKGLMPSDWKPMPTVGPATYEIRISTAERGGRVEHRVTYVAKFEEAVWVLHAFQKSSKKTSRRDLEIGRKRYATMLDARENTWTSGHGEP